MTIDAFTPTIPGQDDDSSSLPELGASIGRFLVLGPLGAGGMATVISAYDPQLDRKVALKLLRTDVMAGRMGREALAREAQAMARLSHPNVVAVHEIVFDDRASYLVMEQIHGSTLRAWMRKEERGWEQVLGTLLAAGAGLAAAHKASLVHHDFKPENVLVGDDGRPRVSDFGLAGAGTPGAGTLAYMAPEQRAGDVVDARSDIYAFCVTTWEALSGSRPGPDRAPPPGRTAPRWIYRVLARGLAPRPEDRWPTMDALLHALRRRRALGPRAGVAATALLAVGIAAFVLGRQGSAAPMCGGAQARLADVWDAPRREAVRAAFAATRLPYHADAWREASDRIDRYARGWVAMHEEACRATHVEGRQSDMLLDLRMECLERRRDVLASLTALWAREADGGAVAGAVAAADGLAPLHECADVRALTERHRPGDPALLARVAAARRSIDHARVLWLAGRWTEADQVTAAARVEAEATGWPNAIAEALFAEGKIRSGFARPGASEIFLHAARLAKATRDERLEAKVLIELVHDLAMIAQDSGRALLVADLADGAIAGAGEDRRLRIHLLVERGNALQVAGRYDEARAAFSAAVELATAVLGPSDYTTLGARADLATVVHDQGLYAEARRLGEESLAASIAVLGERHPRISGMLADLARTAERDGDFDGAAGYYRRALALSEELFGRSSRGAAGILNGWGVAELRRGNLDEATAMLERALRIHETVLGPDDTYVASTRTNLAVAYRKLGRHAEALELLERALAVKIKAFGQVHRSTAYPIGNMGVTHAAQGDFAQALALHRRALDVRAQTLGEEHEETLLTRAQVAAALAALGRCDEARPLLEATTPAMERTMGSRHVLVAVPLIVSGRCALDARQPEEAVTLLTRALDLLVAGKAPAVDRGMARWPLARALWAVGQREAARAAARQAETELAADADGAIDRAALRAWLDRRGS